jgi:hypothetical protein
LEAETGLLIKVEQVQSPGTVQILSEFIQAESETSHSAIHKPTNYIYGIRKDYLSSGRSLLFYLLIRMTKLTAVITEAYDCF